MDIQRTVAVSGNNLLGALHPDDLALIKPHLVEMDLDAGHVLYEPGDNVRYAYLPRGSALASFLIIMEEGSAVETAMVGREGAVGGIVSNGRLPAFSRSSVMHGGAFYRIATSILADAKANSPHMGSLFSRYADCLIAQVFQSVACNATHSIEKRTAKWLCAAVDRTGTHELTLTQDQLGSLLGVGRSYASRVISRLKREGVVATRRGAIIIMNVDGLRSRSCGCTRLVTEHFETVLAGIYPDISDKQLRI